MNHDIINSLTSIKCLTELLAEYPALDSGDRACLLDIMCQQAERLVRLSQGLKATPTGAGTY